jgi:hypothetical protein
MANFMDFKFGGVKVGSLGLSSGIFVGQNLQYGWRQSEKFNSTSRNVSGDYNYIEDALNQIQDPDLIDTWVQKPLPWTNLVPPSPAALIQARERTQAYRKASRSHKLDRELDR